MNTVHAIPDPNVALHRQLGERISDAHRELERVGRTLAHIDDLRGRLRKAGVEVNVDLGDVGNACAVARRQVESVKPQVFALPKAS